MTPIRLLSLFLVALTACQATLPPPPPEAKITPIALTGESEPILFQQVVFRIPSGTRLGAWYWRESDKQVKEIRWNGSLTKTSEFNIAAMDHITSHGYRAVDPTKTLFTDDDSVKTRYRLGGIVTRADIRGHLVRPVEESYAVATVDMQVTLFDSVRKEMVYERSFPGWGRDTGQDPYPLTPAVLNALDKALTDPAFAALVVRGGAGTRTADEPIHLPVCASAAKIALPAQIESVRRAVLTIRSGSITGTGVLVSPEGHALTAGHVVSGLDEVRVVLESGLELPARVLRVDLQTDAALIQVSGARHTCVAVGPEPAIGEDVYVIGSALGEELMLSVSKGIVSGRREIEGVTLIQTDASTNPGTSGGPLLDAQGRIAGIVTQKVFGVGLEGLAFALPTELVRQRLGLR
ncbi:MAG TPA: serine protease [Myxococcota bacterium]|nr:serine protease [Myxococcota bacterium]